MVRSRWERRASTKGPSKVASGVLAVLLASVTSACGGSAAVNDSIGRLTPPGTEVPFSGAVPSGVPPVVPGTAPVDNQAFCQDLRQLQALLPAFVQANGSAAARRQAEALVTRFFADAPAALRPAVQQLAETARRLSADLGTNPPNLADVAGALTDPAYQQALQRLGAYAATHC
ncbi:MAG: hypothetical protein QOJ52_991 [Acidimicrobiaceae bacterium]|nr:hypothetical protein [Acidimicrobiaceae bacterium]